jgi:GNAT superfamily N-acetyltransferase
MQRPPDAPEWLQVVTGEDRPDLWESVNALHLFDGVWPEYNHHGNHSPRYFGALMPTYADLQVLLVDERWDRVVARGRTIPFRWDGTLGDLPAGIDGVGIRAITESGPPNALSALAAEVNPAYQRSGVSTLLIKAMSAVARLHGFANLLAPVRPSWKDRYPLTPIDRYVEWRREDGLPFDPWLRTHERLSGKVLRCEQRSLEITAPIEDWEDWIGIRFPEDGTYVFPGGLAPLDVSDGTGSYFEPNVWMIHEPGRTQGDLG